MELTEEHRQSLFSLRVWYRKLLEILEAFCGNGSSYVLSRDEELNYYYTVISETINGILKRNGFEELSKEKPELFDSLIGNIEDADIEWEFMSKNAYDFLGKIERLYISTGGVNYKLQKETEEALTKIDIVIKEHQRACGSAWKRFTDNADKIRNDLGFNKSEKQEEDIGLVNFDPITRILSLKGASILISKKEDSDSHKLMRTLFKAKRVWANDEILEDWGYRMDDKTAVNKVYQAGKQINSVVAQEVQIKDFIEITTKSASINKKYLKS